MVADDLPFTEIGGDPDLRIIIGDDASIFFVTGISEDVTLPPLPPLPPLSCPRAYGLASTQAECGSGATLYVKFALIARR